MSICKYLSSVTVALAAVLPAQHGDQAAAHAAHAGPVPWIRTEPWPPAVVEAMASLPLQWDGRIAPLSTLAAVSLYSIHGRRDMKLTEPKVTLSPTEWLLDVWCHPEQANSYPLFRVENALVYGELGIDRDARLRMQLEYLSYDELVAHSDRLGEQAAKYAHKPDNARTPLEEHVLDLDRNLKAYYSLMEVPYPMRGQIPLEGKRVQDLFGGKKSVTWSELLTGAEKMGRLMMEQPEVTGDQKDNLGLLLSSMKHLSENEGVLLGLMPPLVSVKEEPRWLHPGSLARPALRNSVAPVHLKMVQLFEQALQAKDLPSQATALVAFRNEVGAHAERRGELSAPVREASYNAWNLSYKALHWFLFAFLLVAASWFAPRVKVLWWAGMVLSTFSLGLVITDIVWRCVIRSRPPITNLFDTILFITAVSAFSALVIEAINRRRIGLSVAPFLGALGIQCARMFEVEDGKDTMRELVAVLDSNFWLATHVTIINTGYAAGMLAAALGSVWILLRLIGVRRGDQAFYSGVYRMVYGATCFGLLFAVVGTILGGIWANESWGRFWGWDPKENGALLICLTQIAMLHARMSGLVKQLGFCIFAAVTGMVVCFSWFHVNLLGVGLHSYGFAGGLSKAVWIYYGVSSLFVLGGVVVWFLDTFQRRTADTVVAPDPTGLQDMPAK